MKGPINCMSTGTVTSFSWYGIIQRFKLEFHEEAFEKNERKLFCISHACTHTYTNTLMKVKKNGLKSGNYSYSDKSGYWQWNWMNYFQPNNREGFSCMTNNHLILFSQNNVLWETGHGSERRAGVWIKQWEDFIFHSCNPRAFKSSPGQKFHIKN